MNQHEQLFKIRKHKKQHEQIWNNNRTHEHIWTHMKHSQTIKQII